MLEARYRLDRALGAYLGLAIGDALGATVEFMRPQEIRSLHGTHRDIVGGGWLKLARGQVTDDTTLSLALGDALVEAGATRLHAWAEGRDESALALVADSFVRWLRARPVDCGNTCRRGIQRYLSDASLQGPLHEGDAGNGALMRNLPVVLLMSGDVQGFERLSLGQARLTHHHPLSDAATLGLGHLTRAALTGISACELAQQARAWGRANPAFQFEPYPGRATAYVVDTVQTVLYHLCLELDFESVVVETVNRGDDADTTGALVGMLAGALCGASALPRRWLERLQPGTVRAIVDQVSHLLALSVQLCALQPSAWARLEPSR